MSLSMMMTRRLKGEPDPEQDVPTVRYNEIAYQLKIEKQLQEESNPPITQRNPLAQE